MGEDKGIKGLMIIEAEIGGHCIHRMYVDGESALEILYEHYFNRLFSKIKNQLVSAITPLIGFSAWMNFMVVRSPSPYNGIIGRPGVRKLQAVPSIDHEMLKIPVEGRITTLKAAWVCSPVRQKKLGQAADRIQGIQEEVKKLVKAGIMKEVHYHDWLSNPVMVKKHDDSWRMCIDFKDLNKACPKDGYRLPEIDWKNARATYQRLVDKAFHKQIGKNLEVYVDYLVIKSRTEDEIARDIEETFKTLREINMKLNPKKCTFGIEEGMFLGYNVSTRGLKVCPDKVDAVLSLPSPKCLKDVQKLNGKLTSLNRFLAKLSEKSLPLFKTLKKCTKKSDFHWTAEAKEAFKKMKQLIAEFPMLVAPMEKEEVIVYLAAAKKRALKGLEINYTSMGKLVLALVLSRPEVAGRTQEWSIELGEYAIHYMPRVLVKGQILADFIVERPEEDSPDTLMTEKEELTEPWILFIDGSSYTDGSGAGLILTNPEGAEFTYALRFSFKAFSIKQVPRSENKKADALSKIASTSFAHLIVEEEGDTWMTPIFMYLTDGTLPTEIKKASAVRRKSWQFAIINGTLYKKSFLGPWLSLGEGIKAMLDARSKNWLEEFPHVLWAHRTMIKSCNGDTTFSLTYGTEAVISA
nr:reverse transcriptase domain-containing protein [Tanacetum cinerariifolium]